tara:strand:- start:1588 stop:1839 length:252 start_codon:yes stop_codon:yes gene_type:complete
MDRKKLNFYNGCDEIDGCRWYNDRFDNILFYKYDEQTGTIILSVAAQPLADEIAINGYLNLLKSIHNEYSRKYNLKAIVWQAD